jgi:hypothetical protein
MAKAGDYVTAVFEPYLYSGVEVAVTVRLTHSGYGAGRSDPGSDGEWEVMEIEFVDTKRSIPFDKIRNKEFRDRIEEFAQSPEMSDAVANHSGPGYGDDDG